MTNPTLTRERLDELDCRTAAIRVEIHRLRCEVGEVGPTWFEWFEKGRISALEWVLTLSDDPPDRTAAEAMREAIARRIDRIGDESPEEWDLLSIVAAIRAVPLPDPPDRRDGAREAAEFVRRLYEESGSPNTRLRELYANGRTLRGLRSASANSRRG